MISLKYITEDKGFHYFEVTTKVGDFNIFGWSVQDNVLCDADARLLTPTNPNCKSFTRQMPRPMVERKIKEYLRDTYSLSDWHKARTP